MLRRAAHILTSIFTRKPTTIRRVPRRQLLSCELLEARVVPSGVNVWNGGTGGNWADAARWSKGRPPIPTDDEVMVNLDPGETLYIPSSVAAEVSVLSAWGGRIEVDGSLTLTGQSEINSEFDVDGSVTVAVPALVPSVPPGEELSILQDVQLPYGLLILGGGDITGTITTLAGSKTLFGMHPAFGEKPVHVADSGSLAGGGWFSVVGTHLSFDGTAETVGRLYAGANGVITGAADLTVSAAFILQGATLAGPAGSLLTNQGYAYVVAPIPGSVNDIRKNVTNAAGKEWVFSGDATVGAGAVFKNLGTVKVTAPVILRNGAGGGEVENKSDWNIAANFTVEVPFFNTRAVDTHIGDQFAGVVKFADYHQSLDGLTPYLNAPGTQVHVGGGHIDAGYINGKPGGVETPPGTLLIDSTLASDGHAKFNIGHPAGPPVDFSELTVVADSASQLLIQAPPDDPVAERSGVTFELCDVTLRGSVKWESGRINAPGSTFSNEGSFEVKTVMATCGFYGGTFTNQGTFLHTAAAIGNLLIFSPASIFINPAGGTVALLVGETRFRGETAFAGQWSVGTGASAVFSGTNEFSSVATIGNNGKVTFIGGTSTLTTGAAFIGEGLVSIQGSAVWEVPFGKNVLVHKLVLEPDPATGMGFGTIQSPPGPGPELPLPQITITTSIHLDAFRIDRVLLSVLPGAVGWIDPDFGMTAEFRNNAVLRVEGSVYWTGDDFLLMNNSQIWVGGGTPQAPATFGIQTTATARQPGGDTCSVIVAAGGWLGRMLPPIVVDPTTFQMPIVNEGGTIVWNGLVVP